MGDIKQTNFRVDQEKADLFRAYCEEQGINQAVGFDRMLEALELQQAKVVIPSREAEIGEFERCLHHLQSAYLNSLEMNEQAEARIRDEFARQITSKDKTIADYQDRLEAAKAEAAELSAVRLQLMETQQAVAEERAKLKTKDEQLADKENIIVMLTEKLVAAEAKAEGYDKLKADRDELEGQLKEAQITIKELNRDHEIALERAEMASQIAASKALQEAKDAAHEAAMAMQAEIRKLEAEKAELRETVAKLSVREAAE